MTSYSFKTILQSPKITIFFVEIEFYLDIETRSGSDHNAFCYDILEELYRVNNNENV
jgi:hypothetical protein